MPHMFQVLRPLRICSGGMQAQIGSVRQRAFLLALLLNANRSVSLDWLTEAVWDTDPPVSATANLRTYASALRRVLPAVPEVRLIARDQAYELSLPLDCLDLSAFYRLAAAGQAALVAGDHQVARRTLDEALALWEGPIGAGLVCGKPLAARIAMIEERRLCALEDRAEAWTGLRRHTQVVADMRELLAEEPLRERAWGLLMRALYCTGDTAGALSAYAEARSVLVDRLGIEPGAELVRLQQAILRRDPELGGNGPRDLPEEPDPSSPVPRCAAPRQLPRRTLLVGRESEVALLKAALLGARACTPVVAVTGPVGVGKSALALQVGIDVAEQFPDGQLYADLRGPRPREQRFPGTVIAGWARALGAADEVAAAMAPEAAAALLRSLTAGRRILFVLDNAMDEKQVRPMLPAGPGCAVLVTSRRKLALDHVTHLTLDVLAADDAVQLLAELAGADRVAAQRQAAAELVQLCEHLPLALRIAGARLAARPHWPLTLLADRLADEHLRLDTLRYGDLSVRRRLQGVYESIRQADATAARLLRLLGQVNAGELDCSVAAGLLGCSAADAEAALDRLADEHLLFPASPGRYRAAALVGPFALGFDRPVNPISVDA